MRDSSGTTITMAGGQSHNVTNVGNIAIKLPSSVIQKIESVLYSPGKVRNLLLVGFLASKGFSIEFKEKNYAIRDQNGELITTSIRKQNSAQKFFNVSQKESLSMTWHCRLGHTHFHGMSRLIQHSVM